MSENNAERTMVVQDALEMLGPTTRYHKVHMTFLQYAAIVAGLHTFIMVFLTLEPVPTCLQEHYPCDGKPTLPMFEYCAEPGFIQKNYELIPAGVNHQSDAKKETSLVLEFQLVCENQHLLSLIGSGYFFGNIFGTIMFGGLADKIGRQRAFAWSNIVLCLTSAAGAFATDYFVLVLIRVLHGFACGGLFVVTFVYLTEMFPKSVYSFVGVLNQSAFAIGYLAVSPVAYTFTTWRELCLIPAAFCLPLIPWSFFGAEESPRWLSSQNYTDKAHHALKRIASSSSQLTRMMSNVKLVPQWSQQQAQKKEQGCKETAGELCGPLILRVFLIAMCCMWMAVCCAYYGIATSAEYIGGSVYQNNILLALLEFPAQALVIYSSKSFGNHGGCQVMLLGTAVSCLFYLLQDPTLQKVSIFTAQTFGCASMSIVYLYTAEVYPTQARSAMIGLSSAAGRFGSMVAMQLRHYGNRNPAITMMCWGLTASLGGYFFTKFLPTTDGMAPPESVEEFTQRAQKLLSPNANDGHPHPHASLKSEKADAADAL